MIYVYNFIFVVVFGLYILMYKFCLPQNEDITKFYKFHCYHFIRQFSGLYSDLFHYNLNFGESFLYFKDFLPQVKGGGGNLTMLAQLGHLKSIFE